VINRTPFDIELIDSSRLIRGNGEGTVTLPRYGGELDDGYSLSYRVKLLGGVYIPVRREERVMVKPGQKTLLVETAEFTTGETFVVVKNKSPHTVRIRNGESYLIGLENAAPRRRYGTAGIAAGGDALFDGIPPAAALAVESDNYRTFPFPVSAFKSGYRYVFAFDGGEVELTDARPLAALYLPVLAGAAFDGLPEDEREGVLRALDGALEAAGAPLRVLPGGGVLREEGDEDPGYVFSLNLVLGRSQALRRELHTAEAALTLSRSGRLIAEAKTSITEFDERNVYRVLRRFITEEKQFYRAIAEKSGL
jgi:hypothetical protein